MKLRTVINITIIVCAVFCAFVSVALLVGAGACEYQLKDFPCDLVLALGIFFFLTTILAIRLLNFNDS